MSVTRESTVSRTGRADRLEQHHRELDARFERLVERASAGDPAELRAEWTAFERELLRHLELEEAEILPAFAAHDAAEARAILAEHAEIRAALLDMGLNLDLHLLRAEAIEAFVQRLRTHARREDAALYAWAERHVPPAGWRSIEDGLREAAGARADRGVRGLFRGRMM
jgi:hemerythrin-like domain-containing protein